MTTPAISTEATEPLASGTGVQEAGPLQITVLPETTPPSPVTPVAAAILGTSVEPAKPFSMQDLPLEIQQRLERAKQIEQQMQQQRMEQSLLDAVAQFKSEALARGMTDEDAEWFSRQHGSILQRVAAQQQQAQERENYYIGKRNAAQHYGRLYGVSAEELNAWDYTSEQQMEQRARELKERADMRREFDDFRKSRVAPQQFNSPGIGAGTQGVSRDNIDALWIQGRISDQDYRQFLNDNSHR